MTLPSDKTAGGSRAELWRDAASRLTELLSLGPHAAAVGITFAAQVPEGIDRFDGPMSEPTPDGRRGRVPAGCVFWAEGAERAFATVPEDHGNCTIGSITHGMLRPEQAAGRLDVASLVETGWVGPSALGAVPAVRERPGAVVYAPLGTPGVEPDVVLLRVDARQMMLLDDACPDLVVSSKPQCGVIATAKERQVPAASFGCALSRQRTGMRDQDMTCALPAPRLEEILSSLDHAASASSHVADYARDDARRFASVR